MTQKITETTSAKIPNDPIAEKAAISMLSWGGQHVANAWPWREDLFFHPAHKQIFSVIVKQLQKGSPVDYLALCQIENNGGMSLMLNSGELTDILLTLPQDAMPANQGTTSLAKYYFDILDDCLQRRGFMVAAGEDMPGIAARTMTPAESIEHITKASAGVGQHEIADSEGDELLEELEGITPRECFTFGLDITDRNLDGGIHRGELCVILGRPGTGKSILLAMAAKEAGIDAKKKVLFITLEMPSKDIKRRIASNMIGARLKSAIERPSDQEAAQILDTLREIRESGISFLSKTDTISEIERQAALLKPDLLIVDYMQLIRSEGDTRAEIVGDVSHRLKDIARQNKIVVLTAAQINDDGRVRESRAPDFDADQEISIEMAKGNPILAVRKNRRGPKDVIEHVIMRGELGRFEHRE